MKLTREAQISCMPWVSCTPCICRGSTLGTLCRACSCSCSGPGARSFRGSWRTFPPHRRACPIPMSFHTLSMAWPHDLRWRRVARSWRSWISLEKMRSASLVRQLAKHIVRFTYAMLMQVHPAIFFFSIAYL